MANGKLFSNERIQEFSIAALLLSVFHWFVAGVLVGAISANFREFFFSVQYILFFGALVGVFFVIEFIYRQLKVKRNVFLRGFKYYLGLVAAVSFVLNEPITTTLLLATILKVAVTITILE